MACLAPSVGFSQPWRWVVVEDSKRRDLIGNEFRICNEQALGEYSGERAALYSRLKLAGLREAPVHLALFIDPDTETGSGLGRGTMPETLAYSAVCALHTLWLAARAHGVGLGWVSILRASEVSAILEVPAGWQLIAYLCLGYPEREDTVPELEREGWERRVPSADSILRR